MQLLISERRHAAAHVVPHLQCANGFMFVNGVAAESCNVSDELRQLLHAVWIGPMATWDRASMRIFVPLLNNLMKDRGFDPLSRNGTRSALGRVSSRYLRNRPRC